MAAQVKDRAPGFFADRGAGSQLAEQSAAQRLVNQIALCYACLGQGGQGQKQQHPWQPGSLPAGNYNATWATLNPGEVVPVPEPAALALAGSGLAALAVLGSHRRRRFLSGVCSKFDSPPDNNTTTA